MSKEIDERVVEMQFDNSNFEKNVQTSMNTLEKLKSALNMSKSEKSLSDLSSTANNIKFDGLTTAVESISNRFSTMGIVGMTVLQNLTNAATTAVTKIASSVKNLIVQGGISRALNIEEAKFRLEGLKVAWEDIEEDINYGVKDTAYGLDSAAKAASVLVASGVKLGDEMKTALRGISGVSAMTSSDFDSIANIYETISGTGKLMTMQLRQLETRGLNAAATLANVLGKTESQIREMVSKGAIDFATFAKAMDDAFGEHAKDANKTYTGALANVKAALARVGAKFATPGLESLRQIFVSLIPIIDNTSSSLNSFVEIAENTMTKLSVGIQNALGYIRLIQSGRSLTDAIFGNIDTNNRQVIKWTDKNIKKYKNEMEDWGIDPKKIKGDISTVLGSYSTVTNSKGENINIAFSPMLQTENGAVLLSSKTVNKYITKLIEKAGKDWTGEDLLKLDASGLEVDEQRIHGLLADVGDTAKETSELMHYTGVNGALNEMSQSSKNLINALFNLLDAAKSAGQGIISFFRPIAEEFDAILTPNITSTILTLSKGLKSLTDNLGLTEKGSLYMYTILEDLFTRMSNAWNNTLISFNNIWKAISTTLYPVKDAFVEVFGNLFDDKSILSAGYKIGNLIEIISEKFISFTNNLGLTGTQSTSLYNGFVTLFTIIKDGINYIKTFGGRVSGLGEAFSKVGDKLKEFVDKIKIAFDSHHIDTSKLTEFAQKLKDSIDPIDAIATIITSIFEGLGKLAVSIMPYIVNAFSNVGNAIKNFVLSAKEAISNGDSDKMMSIINGGMFATVLYVFKDFVNTLDGLAKRIAQVTTGGGAVTDFLNTVRAGVLNFNKGLKVDLLVKTAGAIALLATSCLILTGIDEDKLSSTFAMITGLISVLTIAVAALTGVNAFKKDSEVFFDGITNIKYCLGGLVQAISQSIKLNAISNTLLKMAESILILSVAVKIIGSMDNSSIISSVGAIVILLGALTGITLLLSNFQGDKNASTKSLMSMAIAIDFLAIAVKSLGKMDIASLSKGVGSIIILLSSLMGTMAGLSKLSDTDTIKSVSSLLSLSVAIAIMSKAVEILGSMELKDLAKGEGALLGLLSMIVAFCGATEKLKIQNIGKTASALLIFSEAIAILSVSMKILGSMDWENLAKGILAIGSLLGIISVFSSTMESLKNINSVASSLVIFSSAIAILALSMKVLATLEFESAITAIIAIGSLVTIFGLLATVAQNITGLTAVAASLVIFAAAIAILVPPLILLSSIPIGNLFAAILSLATVLAILGAAATVLQPVIPQMLLIAGILAGLGVSCALAGVGLLAMGAGLTSIAAAVTASGGAILAFVASIIGLIPLVIVEIGKGIIQALQVIIDAAPVLLNAVTVLLNVLLTAAINVLPKVNNLITILIVNVCSILVNAATTIANAALSIIIAVLSAINNNIYQIVDLACDIITNFLEAISDNLPDIIKAGVDVITAFMDGIGDNIGRIADAGFDLIIDFIDGISESIEKNHKRLQDSILNLVDTIIKTAVDGMSGIKDKFLEVGKNIIAGLKEGIATKKQELVGKLEKIANLLPETVKKLLGIHSPSRVFLGIGKFSMLGWANGVARYGQNVIDSIRTVVSNSISAVKNFSSGLASIVDGEIDYNPTIRPVLDLSNVQEGANAIGGMFSSASVGLLSTVGGINQMMNNRQNATNNDDIVGAINKLRRGIEENPNNVYNVDGITYEDGSSMASAVSQLIAAARLERRT